MILIEYTKHNFVVKDQSSVDVLRRGHFGKVGKQSLVLSPEEALYLIDMRNAQCKHNATALSFNDVAAKFWKTPKFAARYFTYKDWRDRGLVIKPSIQTGASGRGQTKEYPQSELKLGDYPIKGTFFKSDLITVLDESEEAKWLYDELWFGQYGSYKAADRGRLNKLDIYETVFLLSKGALKLDNVTKNEVIKLASGRRRDFQQLYNVYSDWRSKGYVIKTGFKFGTHFRVYFPGAKPAGDNNSSWVHSKHVIHVFPKEARLLISEWARVIRVAHSVRKTFILAVPGTLRGSAVHLDYNLYHRKGGDAEVPGKDMPRYAMLSLSEEEYIGGSGFASAIKEAKDKKLELILAIADRETAVTYYKVKQVKLRGSTNEYYEIDWMQP
ncbi:MAG: tRNA-intron lyase [Candidatus Micrarchaeota archaeon]|nr:tRNA-intron lyase [Candidatus Micrarchaeota archaeon]MDE1859001.1 tRNA-intron lyase [Candidatus Micrarchaeota archaeon]